jgi:hypothetical protein
VNVFGPQIFHSKYSPSWTYVHIFDSMSHLRTSGKDCISHVGPIWLFSNAHIARGMDRRTGESLSLHYHSQLIWHFILAPFLPILNFLHLMIPLHPFMSTFLILEHVQLNRRDPSPLPLMISLFSPIVPYVEQPHIMYIVYFVNNTPRTSCRTLHTRVQQFISPLPQRKVNPIIYYGHKKWN